MATRIGILLAFFAISCLVLTPEDAAHACCAVSYSGKPVVNADQTVVILWDAASKTQHFIRQASFKSGANDFGFLIPTPAQPELSESGNEAFAFLKRLTAPRIEQRAKPSRGLNCGCGEEPLTTRAAKSV